MLEQKNNRCVPGMSPPAPQQKLSKESDTRSADGMEELPLARLLLVGFVLPVL